MIQLTWLRLPLLVRGALQDIEGKREAIDGELVASPQLIIAVCQGTCEGRQYEQRFNGKPERQGESKKHI